MTSSNLYGVVASPHIHKLVQPDGSVINAKQWGDEWLHGWETSEGYTIVKDNTGFWVYADRDSTGRLIPTGMKGNRPPLLGLQKSLHPSGEMAQKAITKRKRVYAKVVPSTGTANIPVILINFNDTATTNTPADFESLLFGNNPAIATGPGSMKNYYEEVSYEAFSVSSGPSGVSGWHTGANGHDYYGNEDAQTAELVREAVLAADAAGFDFSQYDSDGDGKVDVVGIVHQGRGEEESGVSTDIWSHRLSLSSAGVGTVSVDGVIVDDYVIMPERYGTTSISTIGVFAHEFGHSLGLPDLYDTDDSSEGIGNWGLMGGGSWNQTTNSGDTPAHFTAWSKYFLGWVTPTQVQGFLENEQIDQAATNQDVYMLLYNPGEVNWAFGSSGTGEYFLVENRQQVGFDAGLPGSGLLVWHVWEEAPGDNTANQNEGGAKLVDLEEADGLAQLDGIGNRGDNGDPFPGSSINRTFNDDTNPNSLWYDGRRTGCGVINISNSGSPMAADMYSRFAVTLPWWDDIGAILISMGYSYFDLKDEYTRLSDPDFLKIFDTIFINCAGDIYVDTSIANAVSQYISDGGGLYASDWAFPYIQDIFPDYINYVQPDPRIGIGDQNVTAAVTDSSLANYLGSSTMNIYYNLWSWVVIDSVGLNTNVLLMGDIEASSSPSLSPALSRPLDRTPSLRAPAKQVTYSNSVLAASFQYGSGIVIYTTFHNEAQATDLQKKFLEYTVLLPLAAADLDEITDLLEGLGYQIDDTIINAIDEGEELSFSSTTTEVKNLAFALGWEGSTLKLSVYKSDGPLFDEKESSTPPIIIEVPQAEAGTWTYKVTGVDTPYNNYPFAAAVGANSPPVADFTWSPVDSTTSDTIQFTDSSTDSDGTISTWSWDFGDGETSTLQNPTHLYTAAGTYTVTLTVTDNGGATGNVQKDITVNSASGPGDGGDGGSGGGGGGCFVATAAFGSPMEAHVKVLSEFRDCFLLTNGVGRCFVDFYYTYSPPVADFNAKLDTLRAAVRWGLMPVVGVSWMAQHLGPWATLSLVVLLLGLTGATAVVVLRRMRLRRQA